MVTMSTWISFFLNEFDVIFLNNNFENISWYTHTYVFVYVSHSKDNPSYFLAYDMLLMRWYTFSILYTWNHKKGPGGGGG